MQEELAMENIQNMVTPIIWVQVENVPQNCSTSIFFSNSLLKFVAN